MQFGHFSSQSEPDYSRKDIDEFGSLSDVVSSTNSESSSINEATDPWEEREKNQK